MSNTILYDEFQDAMEEALKNNSGREIRVSIMTFHKLNSSYHGVQITDLAEDQDKSDGTHVEPIFNMDLAYKKFLTEGVSVDDLAKEILAIRTDQSEIPASKVEELKKVLIYDQIKDRLVIRATGTENEEFLSNHPHRVYGDIAFVCYILWDRCKDGEAIICVANHMLESYKEQGITFDRLFEDTCRNSANIYPPFTMDIYKSLGESDMMDIVLPERKAMYVVTNQDFSYGAGVVMYEGFLEEFSRRMFGGSDLLIIPSSVQETIITNYDPEYDDLENLEQIIAIENSSLQKEQILSNHLYYYETSTGFFGFASEKIGAKEAV